MARGCGCLALGLLAVVVLVAIFGGRTGAGGNAVGAYVMCQEFVKGRLKSPGSAEFPLGSTPYTERTGDTQYRVTAFVDSQNGFGALLRTNFVCEIESLPNDKWRLVSLTTKPR